MRDEGRWQPILAAFSSTKHILWSMRPAPLTILRHLNQSIKVVWDILSGDLYDRSIAGIGVVDEEKSWILLIQQVGALPVRACRRPCFDAVESPLHARCKLAEEADLTVPPAGRSPA